MSSRRRAPSFTMIPIHHFGNFPTTTPPTGNLRKFNKILTHSTSVTSRMIGLRCNFCPPKRLFPISTYRNTRFTLSRKFNSSERQLSLIVLPNTVAQTRLRDRFRRIESSTNLSSSQKFNFRNRRSVATMTASSGIYPTILVQNGILIYSSSCFTDI